LFENENEVLGCIKNKIRKVENKFGRNPKIIRSGGGGEYILVDFETEKFLTAEDIKH
jgi:PHP family Zn ribbon phosphoesterase